MIHTPCPLCNCARHRVVTRYGGEFNTPTRNILCLQCGFLYRNPRWNEAEAAQFYRHLGDYYVFAYKRDRLSESEADYDTALARGRVPKLSEYVPAPARVLDVGAGTGAFVRECLAAGFEAEGIDLDEDCVKEAQQHGLRVELVSLAEANLPQHHFDAITMFDVLEHVVDLPATLQRIGELLRPDGLLMVEVPDVLHLATKFSYVLPPEHNWHFSVNTLRRLFECQGWDVIELAETQNALGHPILLAIARPVPDAVPSVSPPEPDEVDRVLQCIKKRRREYRCRPIVVARDILTTALGPRRGMRVYNALTGCYCALKRVCGLYRETAAAE